MNVLAKSVRIVLLVAALSPLPMTAAAQTGTLVDALSRRGTNPAMNAAPPRMMVARAKGSRSETPKSTPPT